MSKSIKPLHQAIWDNDVKRVDYLVKESNDLNEEDENGLRPLDIAIISNNDSIASSLLKDKNVVVDKKTWFYLTFAPNETIISRLVENGSTEGCQNIQDETPLHHAVMHGCEKLINTFRVLGCNVNSRTKNGYTPLHYAAIQGNERIVQILLEKGADVNMKTLDGKNPLHLAVKNRHKNIVNLLLNKKVDVNEHANFTESTALHFSVENNDRSMVKFLIEKKANLQAKNFAGENLLHTAAKCGFKNLVKFFLNTGIDIDSVTKNNSTALLIAIENGKMDVCQLLLTHKADINIANNSGLSPLLVAIKQRNTDLSSKLLTLGADINQITSENSSVVHFALQYNDRNVVDYLLQQKLKVNRRNQLGENELHFAARYSHEDAVEFLIKQGINVNETTINQSTPLHYAISNTRFGVPVIIEKLLKHGAEVNAEDKDGNTALNILCQKSCVNFSSSYSCTMRILLENGSDPNHSNKNQRTPLLSNILISALGYIDDLVKYGGNINQLNNNGDNALHIIIRHKIGCSCTRISHEKSVIALGAKINGVNRDDQTPLITCLEYSDFREGTKEIEFLMENGAQMTKNKYGESVLHLSIKKGNNKLVEYFLEKGADIYDKTLNESSVLHYAAKYMKDKEVIEKIITKSNNTSLVHRRDRGGRVPLHIAALHGANELIEILLKYDANINAKDYCEDTPINFAIKGGHIETVKLLLKNGASITGKNNKGLTVYDLAEQEKRKHIYQYLLLR